MVGGVGGCVGVRPEGFEVGGEGGLTGGVEAAEGDLGGAEVGAEEGDGAGGVRGKIEVEGDESGLNVGEAGGEALPDGGVVAPEDGWRDTGRWRTWKLPSLNIAPVKLPGFQLAIARWPPGLSTRASSEATSSGRGANMAPNMVTTASKEAVRIGKLLRVALVEGCGEALGCGTLAGLGQQVRGNVDPGDDAACRASGMARLPVPQATSSTRDPAGRASRSTNLRRPRRWSSR